MNKKRSRLEVIHDILIVIQERDGRIKPTHILYKSNLSHQMLSEYISELKEKEMIIEISKGTSKTYSLTQKGYDYLNKYKMIREFISSFGLED